METPTARGIKDAPETNQRFAEPSETTWKFVVEFYSGTSEYYKAIKNGIDKYFCITHITLKGKPYAVIRGITREDNLDPYIPKEYIRENETIVYENDEVLANVIVKDDHHIIIDNDE